MRADVVSYAEGFTAACCCCWSARERWFFHRGARTRKEKVSGRSIALFLLLPVYKRVRAEILCVYVVVV